MPTHEHISKLPGIHRLGSRITEPNLWHINRRSISGAVFWGIICAWIPFPSQMLLAAICAIVFRVNLPLCIALTWVTNPFTLIPIFYSSYVLGSVIFGIPLLEISQIKIIIVHLTTTIFGETTRPLSSYGFVFDIRALLVGLIVEALVVATLAKIFVQWLWRWHVIRDLRIRQEERKNINK
ncbi:MAG TPA: DUF2062 domain-containing protein [Aquirhabdus sp.]